MPATTSLVRKVYSRQSTAAWVLLLLLCQFINSENIYNRFIHFPPFFSRVGNSNGENKTVQSVKCNRFNMDRKSISNCLEICEHRSNSICFLFHAVYSIAMYFHHCALCILHFAVSFRVMEDNDESL